MALCGDHVTIVDKRGIWTKELIQNLKFQPAFESRLVRKYFYILQSKLPKEDLRDDSILLMKTTSSPFKTRDDLILKRRGYKTVSNITEGLKTVKVAFCRSRNRKVMVKIMPTHITKLLVRGTVKKKCIEKFVIREINTLRKIKHKNIMDIYGYFRANQKLFLIVEYGPNGSIFEMIRRFGHFEESITREIFKGILAAVCYCHEREIYLRNINCENIYLFKNLQVKLSIVHIEKHLSNFYPPPPDRKIPPSPCSNLICSLGLVLHAMLVGFYPDRFYPKRRCNWRALYLGLDPALPILTRSAVSLLLHMLGSHRIGISINGLIKDPWITAETHFSKETALQYEQRTNKAQMEWQALEDLRRNEELLLAEQRRAFLEKFRLLAEEHLKLLRRIYKYF